MQVVFELVAESWWQFEEPGKAIDWFRCMAKVNSSTTHHSTLLSTKKITESFSTLFKPILVVIIVA